MRSWKNSSWFHLKSFPQENTEEILGEEIWDNKLQVLYMLEAHWLLASQPKQKEYEGKILRHLNQISFLDSPHENESIFGTCFDQ